MGSCLLESIQTIMNNGCYDPREISTLRDQLCTAITEIHPENDYMIEEKSPKEYCEATAALGFWTDTLRFLEQDFLSYILRV